MTDSVGTGPERSPDGAGDDAREPVLADPGSKTQPAEGGREEAADGGTAGGDNDKDVPADDAGG